MKYAFAFLVLAVITALAACAPSLLPRAYRAAPRVLFSVPATRPVVALTIDDGPSAATGQILAVLQEYHARASFFVIGDHVLADQATTRRIQEEGHELAHHMTADEPSIRLPRAVFEHQFAAMDRMLDSLGGAPFFRPASGWFDETMVRAAEERGYRTVLGSVYPFDAQIPLPRFLSWYILQTVRPGGIVILHDGPERGLRTAEVLRRVLPALASAGTRS